MNLRRGIFVGMIGTAALLAVLIVIVPGMGVFPTRKMPLALEFVCFTNVVSPDGRPIWSAIDRNGNMPGLTPAAPSHVLFKLRNQTGESILYRPLLYQFTDSLPTAMAPPNGPSRHRDGQVDPSETRGLDLGVSHKTRFGPIRFGPPDCSWYRTLMPGGTVHIALPRPPFDCVWRPVITYVCPLSKRKLRVHQLKAWLRLKDDRGSIHRVQGGRVYDDYAAWLTNTAVMQGDGVQPTDADPDAPAASMGSQPVDSPR